MFDVALATAADEIERSRGLEALRSLQALPVDITATSNQLMRAVAAKPVNIQARLPWSSSGRYRLFGRD